MHATQPSSPHGSRPRTLVVLAIASVVVFCAVLVAREELPAFRQGMWKFSRTVNGKAVESARCANPTEDMTRQNATLQKSGCTLGPIKRSGNTYIFHADCVIKMPGGNIASQTTTVMTVESDSAYRLEVTGTTDGTPTRESLTARRVGDCAR